MTSCGSPNMNFVFVISEFDGNLGVAQLIDAERSQEVEARIEAATTYLRDVVAPDYKNRYVRNTCKLKDENCAFWAVLGECEKNPTFMTETCAPVCQTCEQLSVESRCPIDLEKMPNAWKPGDLNEFFTNVTTLEEYKKYEPTVLSRPSYLPGDTADTADYKIGPWVVVLENVLSPSEANHLIKLGENQGYKRSADIGKRNADGTYDKQVSNGRTSTNTWCKNECEEDPISQSVVKRVTNITNIPAQNNENLQLLKYEEGQFYETHHDYVAHQTERQSGVRILTVFLYLNEVEEGGGTDFPELGITVQPKQGRVLIWPSVKDGNPDEKDPLTRHQALPVLKGVKYGANAWVHQRDYQTPKKNGCGLR